MSSSPEDDTLHTFFDVPIEEIEAAVARGEALGLSDEEIEQRLLSAVEVGVKDGIDQVAALYLKQERKSRRRLRRTHRRARRAFERRLWRRRGDALDAYDRVYSTCLAAGAAFCRDQGPAEEQTPLEYRFYALRGLHARSCTITAEIYSLLRSGHAAGAMARWRALYEVAVVAQVLSDADQELSERYLAHDEIGNYKDGVAFNASVSRLGLEPFTDEQIAAMKTRSDAARVRYGQGFERDWGWAAPVCPPDRSMNFKTLAEVAGVDHLWPYNKFAMHRGHGGARGTIANVAEFPDGTAVLTAGASNAGLVEPGSSALISLSQTTLALVLSGRDEARANPNNVALAKAIMSLVDDANDEFERAGDKLNADITRYGSSYTPAI